MLFPLASLFALYTLTPGRRIYALNGVRAHATAPEHVDLLKMIDTAIAHDRQALELNAARRTHKATKPPPVRVKDRKVDQTLLAINRLISHFAEDETDPPTAASLLGVLFPISVNHHIRMAFVEQSAANERVLSVLEADTHGAWLKEHGVLPLVKELRTNHEAFSAALRERDGANAPSWASVLTAHETGQELYLQVVAVIVVRFMNDIATREAMLQPIWNQNEAIQAYRRQRRLPVDVNPDTGELLIEVEEGEEGEEVEAVADAPAEAPVDLD